MRIIKRGRINEWSVLYPDAANALYAWYQIARRARWRHLQDVRADLPHADAVLVQSGRSVVVFNVRGGNYRMITAIHYNTQRVYLLRLLTHRQYDTDRWKREL
jgi:mRNA interferase HigB